MKICSLSCRHFIHVPDAIEFVSLKFIAFLLITILTISLLKSKIASLARTFPHAFYVDQTGGI